MKFFMLLNISERLKRKIMKKIMCRILRNNKKKVVHKTIFIIFTLI